MADLHFVDVERGVRLLAALERRKISGDKLHPMHTTEVKVSHGKDPLRAHKSLRKCPAYTDRTRLSRP
jgi:hypothetical protein